jgi:hypothetical protein
LLRHEGFHAKEKEVPFTIFLAPDVVLQGSHENPLHVSIDLAIALVFLLPYFSS